MKRLTLSLKTKMTFGVCLIVAGLTAALAFFSLSYFQRQLSENMAAQQFVLVSALAENLDDKLAGAQDELLKLAQSVPAQALQDPELAQGFLLDLAKRSTTFDNSMVLFSRRGSLIAEAHYAPERRGTNFIFRDYLKETITFAKPVISAPFLSSQNRHPVIALTAPLWNPRGELVGVLAGSLDLTRHNFLGKLAHTRVGRNGYLYLFDSERTLIMHPDDRRLLTRLEQGVNRGFDRAVAGFEGTLETVDSRGGPALASFKRLRTTNWILGANFPQAEAYAGIERSRRLLGAALLLAISFCVALVWFYIEHLTAPLERLANHVRSLAGKSGAERLFASDAGDEIAVLAEAFNGMVRELDAEREALREGLGLLAEAQRLAQLGNWELDPRTGRINWSDEMYRITGLARDAFAGTRESCFGLVHPDDRARLERAVRLALEGGAPFAVEHRLVRPDGTLRTVTSLAEVAFDGQHNPLRIFGTVQDITQRKQAEAGRLAVEEALRESEERLRQIAEHCEEVLFIVSSDMSRMIYINPAYQKLWQLSCQSIYERPSSFTEVIHPEDLPRVLGALEQLTRGTVFDETYRIVRRDRSLRWVHARTYPVRAENGEIYRFVGIAEDVSARKKAMEQELRNARDAAEAANRLKSEFLANMSHEIRTPMNGVIGMAELLRDTVLSREQNEYVQALSSSAESLLRVINDILDFSKLEARTLELQSVDFELRASLAGILRTLAPRASEKGLVLASRVPAGIPDALVGDQGRLMQVIVNLASNAVKFTDSGEVTLSVAAETAGAGEACLRFSVADTGIGISREWQGRIFDPFAQADASATRRHGGTGLGLTISARLVEKMGGTLRVESEPGQGSSFFFTLRLGVRQGLPACGPAQAPSRPASPALPAESGAAEAELFDRRETLARMDGDWELFREVAGIFAADSRMMLGQIRDAIAAGDPPGLNRAAHTLKGAISNFGAPVPFGLALKLEQLGKSGELAGAREACRALEAELELLREALESCAGRMRA